jgi:hypothetical protein
MQSLILPIWTFSPSALLWLVLVPACAPTTGGVDAAIDCSAEDAIEHNTPDPSSPDAPTVFGFAWEPSSTTPEEPRVPDAKFFCFADPTEGGYPATVPWPHQSTCPYPNMEPVEGGPFCQDTPGHQNRHRMALHLQAGNHLFWGGEWGNWNMRGGLTLATLPGTDATGVAIQLPADGIAFWAKRAPGSDSQLMIYLNDENTAATDECIPTKENPGGPQVEAKVTASDPNVQVNSGATAVVQDPRACANRWRAPLEVSEEWELHLLPFDRFYQEPQPNRESESLGPAFIYSISFGFGRGADPLDVVRRGFPLPEALASVFRSHDRSAHASIAYLQLHIAVAAQASCPLPNASGRRKPFARKP